MTPNYNSSNLAAPVATETERLPEPLVDTQGGVTYIGDAPLGTGESEKRWRIKRRSTQGSVTRTDYANGSQEFNQAWADRAQLTYSR